MDEVKSPVFEALKEFARTFILAVIPLAAIQLEQSGFIDFKALGIAGAIAGLRAVDKWLHERKDLSFPFGKDGGLFPF